MYIYTYIYIYISFSLSLSLRILSLWQVADALTGEVLEVSEEAPRTVPDEVQEVPPEMVQEDVQEAQEEHPKPYTLNPCSPNAVQPPS